MKELFLAACLSTGIDCGNVDVTYAPLGLAAQAQASMFADGSYRIEVNEMLRHRKSDDLLGLLVHELSHIIVWDSGNLTPRHNSQYRLVCHGLAETLGVGVKACNPYENESALDHYARHRR